MVVADPKVVHRSAADAPSAFRSRLRCWGRTDAWSTTPSVRPHSALTSTDYAKAWTTTHPALS